mgnify:CR=1 FL=1
MKIVPPLEALDRSAELRRRQLAEERSEPPRRTAVPVPQLVCDHLRPLLQRLVQGGDLARQLGAHDVYGLPHDAALPTYRVKISVQRFDSAPLGPVGHFCVCLAHGGIRSN